MTAAQQPSEDERGETVERLLQLLAGTKSALDRVKIDFDKVQAIPSTTPCVHYCTEFRAELLHQKRLLERLYQMCGECPTMFNFRLEHHPEKHISRILENPRGKSVLMEYTRTLLEMVEAHQWLDKLNVPRQDLHGVPLKLAARLQQLTGLLSQIPTSPSRPQFPDTSGRQLRNAS